MYPQLPLAVTAPQLRIQSPEGLRYIQNPLYNYTFNPVPGGNTFPHGSLASRPCKPRGAEGIL